MIRATAVIAILFAMMGAGGSAVASTEGSDGAIAGRLIVWPSPAFRDLQAAIDAAPDGATIRITAGVYPVREPLLVRGKRLVLEGAGSGLDRSERGITHLLGPPPRPVTDERGRLVLRADAVQGLLNGVAAGLVVQGLRLSGFDAGIVTRDDGERRSGPLVVRDVFISDTGRGILLQASADASITQARIEDTVWNGISVASGLADLVTVQDVTIAGPDGAGIYLTADSSALLIQVHVLHAENGGIVVFKSKAVILDSFLAYNRKAGILLFEAQGIPFIKGNSISVTHTAVGGGWGDGLLAFASDVTAVQNLIAGSDRAGVTSMGSVIRLGDNQIQCTLFDLDYEMYKGVVGEFEGLGGNECGCGPNDTHACVKETSLGFETPALDGQE